MCWLLAMPAYIQIETIPQVHAQNRPQDMHKQLQWGTRPPLQNTTQIRAMHSALDDAGFCKRQAASQKKALMTCPSSKAGRVHATNHIQRGSLASQLHLIWAVAVHCNILTNTARTNLHGYAAVLQETANKPSQCTSRVGIDAMCKSTRPRAYRLMRMQVVRLLLRQPVLATAARMLLLLLQSQLFK